MRERPRRDGERDYQRNQAKLDETFRAWGFIDEGGNVRRPVFKKADEQHGENEHPWELESLPQNVLEGNNYANQDLRRIVWNEVIRPFMENRIRSGMNMQCLYSYWQVGVLRDWEELHQKNELPARRSRSKAGLGYYPGAQRRTNEATSHNQKRKLTEY